ncbi:MAG: serine/threonine-protein kinase HipA, partial [Gammaproteobacteria bacterium]
MVTTAFVKIWGETVGAVALNESTRIASFEYDKKFLQKDWDLSPIKMPISSPTPIFSFPELRPQRNSEYDTFKGLPGLLADALPDKYGNQLINSWLSRNGRASNSMNPIEQLCFIGERGMGAIEFEPSQMTISKRTFSIELDSLVDVAQKMLSNREDFKTGINEGSEKAIKEILKIGTSAGGARPKAVIAFNKKTGEVKSGQTRAPKGFEHWLIKLDGVSDEQFGTSQGYGRVEMAYYHMAKDCGIDIMESHLLEENGRAHFMTKRYDREGSMTKHHVQTWCAMQHVDFNDVHSFSYEQLFQTMRILNLPYRDMEQMFRRMVFNLISKNCDDHTKNFSFRLKQNEPWELAPAYDLCYAYRADSIWVSQHALSINGKRKDFVLEDLLAVADLVRVKKANNIIEEIQGVVSNWVMYAKETGLSAEMRELIGGNHVLIESDD